MRTLLVGAVVVGAALVVDVLDEVVDDDEVVEAGTVDELVVVVGALLLCPLLQPASPTRTRTATTTAPGRPIRGG
jgi:hypothetical protein